MEKGLGDEAKLTKSHFLNIYSTFIPLTLSRIHDTLWSKWRQPTK